MFMYILKKASTSIDLFQQYVPFFAPYNLTEEKKKKEKKKADREQKVIVK